MYIFSISHLFLLCCKQALTSLSNSFVPLSMFVSHVSDTTVAPYSYHMAFIPIKFFSRNHKSGFW